MKPRITTRHTAARAATRSSKFRIMTDFMSTFQDSQKELMKNQREFMQAMLNTTTQTTKDVLSSLKSVETLLTEMKNTTLPIQDNCQGNAARKSQQECMPDASSQYDRHNNVNTNEYNGGHYGHTKSADANTGELTGDLTTNTKSHNKTLPLYTSNDHEFPEPMQGHELPSHHAYHSDTETDSQTTLKEFVAFPLETNNDNALMAVERGKTIVTTTNNSHTASNTGHTNENAYSLDQPDQSGRSSDRYHRVEFIDEPIHIQTHTTSTSRPVENTSPNNNILVRSSRTDRHYVPILNDQLTGITHAQNQAINTSEVQRSMYDHSVNDHSTSPVQARHDTQLRTETSHSYGVTNPDHS